jgi:ABC-type antimicrobial peptide transport system permease subunit
MGGRSYYGLQDPATGRRISMEVLQVSDGYFETVQIPIMSGRPIEQGDWIGAREEVANVVLSAAAAQRLFGSANPLGRTLKSRGFRRDTTVLTVVGVAANARLQNLQEPNPETMYWPMQTLPFGTFSVIARARGSAHALEPELQSALASVDPAIPLRFQVVSDNLNKTIAEQRLLRNVLTLFSVLAVLLSAIGLYGVLGTAVTERRREFGIRIALGADHQRVLSLVVSQSAQIVLIGLVLGIVCAVWLSRLLQAHLYGVSRFSGGVYLAAAVAFGFIALIATAIPVHAATRVEPTVALRQE